MVSLIIKYPSSLLINTEFSNAKSNSGNGTRVLIIRVFMRSFDVLSMSKRRLLSVGIN